MFEALFELMDLNMYTWIYITIRKLCETLLKGLWTVFFFFFIHMCNTIWICAMSRGPACWPAVATSGHLANLRSETWTVDTWHKLSYWIFSYLSCLQAPLTSVILHYFQWPWPWLKVTRSVQRKICQSSPNFCNYLVGMANIARLILFF